MRRQSGAPVPAQFQILRKYFSQDDQTQAHPPTTMKPRNISILPIPIAVMAWLVLCACPVLALNDNPMDPAWTLKHQIKAFPDEYRFVHKTFEDGKLEAPNEQGGSVNQ